jgi:hypothetical protein
MDMHFVEMKLLLLLPMMVGADEWPSSSSSSFVFSFLPYDVFR